MHARVAALLVLTTASILMTATITSAAPPIEITLRTDRTINTHADQVGIWINSVSETLTDDYVTALRELKMRSVRYGWGFGRYDGTESFKHSPADPKAQGYFTDAGRVSRRIGPASVETLLEQIDATGFAVAATDGINYLGTADSELANLPRSDRIDRFSAAAADWAGSSDRFTHFEIGNENDLSGHGEVEGIVQPWTAEAYAEVARRYVTAIKTADPAAHCGINGGLLNAEESIAWFEQIAASQPSLADDLDFLVAHKYEFWLTPDVWRAHPEWDYGRVSKEVRDVRNRLFPKLPIHVTEIGAFKEGANDTHLRAVLQTEMLGNVYLDAAVEHVQVWPSSWGSAGGVFDDPATGALSRIGHGVAAYTRFALPVMCDNGSAGPLRFFAARSHPSDPARLTVWLINHAEQPVDIIAELPGLRDDLPVRTRSHQQLVDRDGGGTLLASRPAIRRDGDRVSVRIPGTAVTVLHW